jgi:hypothetical protein
MLLPKHPRQAGPAMSELVLVLVVACGNDDFNNQQQNHANHGPAHLLIRAPLSVDYPITVEGVDSPLARGLTVSPARSIH